MRQLISDLRYAFRMLSKHAFINGLAILVLAVGIGANSSLFSMIHGVLLSPLPFPEPDRIMAIQCEIRDIETGASGPDYLDWKEQNEVFSDLVAIDMNGKFNLTGAGEPISIKGWRVTTNFYDSLGAKPSIGRGFLPEESIAGNNQVVILRRYYSKNNCLLLHPVLQTTKDGTDRYAHNVMELMRDLADHSSVWYVAE